MDKRLGDIRYSLCECCDEPTLEPFFCAECNKVVCEYCAEEEMYEKGDMISDMIFLCKDCVNKKSWERAI